MDVTLTPTLKIRHDMGTRSSRRGEVRSKKHTLSSNLHFLDRCWVVARPLQYIAHEIKDQLIHAFDRTTLDSAKIPHNSSTILMIPPCWVLGGRTASPLDSLTRICCNFLPRTDPLHNRLRRNSEFEAR